MITPIDKSELTAYTHMRGFVFKGHTNPSYTEDSVYSVCQALIRKDIVNDPPTHIFKTSDALVFLWDSPLLFRGPEFFSITDKISRMNINWLEMSEVFTIQTLSEYVN